MRRRIAVLLVLGMLPAAHAHAQHAASTTFRVSARVEAVCEVTASDVSFGDQAARSPRPIRGSTLLRTICTPNTGYQVGMNQGASPVADVVTGIGTGLTQDHTVFGPVLGSQVFPAGDAGDTITVRIYY